MAIPTRRTTSQTAFAEPKHTTAAPYDADQLASAAPTRYSGIHVASSSRPPQLRNGGVAALTLLRRFVLTLAVGMILWSIAPMAFGWSTSVVQSGSMSPQFNVGDVIAASSVNPKAAAGISRGTVLLMENPAQPGRLLMHRLVRHQPDGTLITKGDANQTEDSTPVPLGNVRGIARLTIPVVGLPQVWLKQHDYPPLAVLAAIFGAVLFWRPPVSRHQA